MGVPKATVQVLIPETMDNAYNYNIVNYLKKLKMQGKMEFDKYVFVFSLLYSFCVETRQHADAITLVLL